MGDHSSIEWTDATWNPIRGCTRVSRGCGGPGKQGGCYAEQIAARFSKPGQPFHGFAERKAGEARWTGKLALIEDMLTLPLSWRKPRKIFVNSMSDLFHENLPDEAIDRVFAVMSLARQHTFQVLTKRPARMRAYCANDETTGRLVSLIASIVQDDGDLKVQHEPDGLAGFRLPNVWLGTSVEDQPAADERLPHLRATPAAVRFVSFEPLLGPVTADLTGIHWAIVGGESGRHARPMHPAWARGLRDQCAAAGVAFFYKQTGEWMPCDRDSETARIQPRSGYCHPEGKGAKWPKPEGLGEYGPYWLEEHGFAHVARVGKKAAGNLLDGRQHLEFPQVHP